MAPITLLLCGRTGMSMILGALAVNYGALGGANFVSSQSGIIFRGLMTTAGVPESEAFINSFAIFVSTMVVPLVVISAFVFFSRSGRALKTPASQPACRAR